MHTAENHSDKTQMNTMTTAVQNPQIQKKMNCTEATEVEQGWKATGDCRSARPRATALRLNATPKQGEKSHHTLPWGEKQHTRDILIDLLIA